MIAREDLRGGGDPFGGFEVDPLTEMRRRKGEGTYSTSDEQTYPSLHHAHLEGRSR